MCPRFLEASRRLERLDPESMYIYFPSDYLWTWEQTRDAEMGKWGPDGGEVGGPYQRGLVCQALHLGEISNEGRWPGER